MGCEGEEQKYSWKDVIPPWQESVAQNLGGLIETRLGEPATKYPGMLTTGVDPLLTAGAGALMGMQGQGYAPPEYMNYGQQGYGTPFLPGWQTSGGSAFPMSDRGPAPFPMSNGADRLPAPGPFPQPYIDPWLMG